MDNSIYGFLVGLHLGHFTGFISNCIITGIVVFIYDPHLFTYENMSNVTLSAIKIITKK